MTVIEEGKDDDSSSSSSSSSSEEWNTTSQPNPIAKKVVPIQKKTNQNVNSELDELLKEIE